MYTRESVLSSISSTDLAIRVAEREVIQAEEQGDSEYASALRSVLDSAIQRSVELHRALALLPAGH